MAQTKPDSSQVVFKPSGTGAVDTTVQEVLRETVSVKRFGAVGDGVTDDTPEVQNAIAYSSNLLFPSGNFYFASDLDFGMATLTALQNTTISTPQFKIGTTNVNGAYRAKLDNLLLDGTGRVCSGTGALYLQNVHKASINDVRITNYTTAGCGSPLLVFGSFLTVFNNLSVQGNLYGATFKKWINAVKVTQGTFANNNNFGCFVQGAIKLTFDTCDIESNGGDGLTISHEDTATYGSSKGITVRDCYFERNKGADIRVGSTGSADTSQILGTIISDNYFYGDLVVSPTYAIRLERSVSAVIENNIFDGAYTKPIYLGANSQSTTIIPFFPDQVEVISGATVSPRTIQQGSVSFSVDASGNGSVNVTFAVPYDTFPVVSLTMKSNGGPGVSFGKGQVTNLTTTGFTLETWGSYPSITVGANWKAGT